MGAAIALRGDFDASGLRRLAKASKDGGQSRRLLALAEIYDGARRTHAARIGAVGLQGIRDWVLRFNAEGPEGLIDRKAPGPPPKLDDGQRRALAALVERGPIPAVDDVVRWRLKDLAQWIWEEFRISLDETTVSRALKAMGFTKMTARPRHHAQNEFAIEDFRAFPELVESVFWREGIPISCDMRENRWLISCHGRLPCPIHYRMISANASSRRGRPVARSALSARASVSLRVRSATSMSCGERRGVSSRRRWEAIDAAM